MNNEILITKDAEEILLAIKTMTAEQKTELLALELKTELPRLSVTKALGLKQKPAKKGAVMFDSSQPFCMICHKGDVHYYQNKTVFDVVSKKKIG